jgi:hypothetical protein
MPTTAPPKPILPLTARVDRPRLAALAGIACLFALAEIVLGLALGGFIEGRRAEAIPFLELRPWLVVAGAAAATGLPVGDRLFAYAVALVAAGANEALLILSLGNPSPAPEMLRGWSAALPLLLACDVAMQLARRLLGRAGRWAAAAAVAVLLLVPPVLAPYRDFVAADSLRLPPGETRKPDVAVMTALPIIWGEGGAFDPNSRPAGSYRALQEEFQMHPLDTLDPQSLHRFGFLLLAQPRWLAAEELVALDNWVRKGGRAVILTDPKLDWHSELPLGDIRRPPPVGLLKPLLDHWRLVLHATDEAEQRSVEEGGTLAMSYPGRFVATGPDCKVERLHRAYCKIGSGRAMLIADADLMRDELWMGPGEDGDARHRRTADNPVVIAALIDSIGRIGRQRVRAPVAWRRPGAPLWAVLAGATLPLALLASALLGYARLRRRAG